MNITFVGIGYVGLVSAVMMSHLGHNITCIDTDQEKILALKKGIFPIYEPGLDEYLISSIKADRLQFVDKYDQQLSNVAAVFITVGTPPLPSGEADLSYIFTVIDNLKQFISKDCTIVIKSTVPPGTSNKLIKYLAASNPDVQLASNPEFLREGLAVEDFINPDRIIVGTNKVTAARVLEEIYAPLIAKNIPFVSTNLTTAELIKYASNAFLATKIAFINEMANLCEEIDANIEQLSQGVGLDSRIGEKFLQVSPGFGGSCFPKDILALSALAKKYRSDCQVIDAVISANRRRPSDMVYKITSVFGTSLANKTLAVLGLTFKAGTDDLRSSPALEIIKLLKDSGANVIAYDPIGMTQAPQYIEDLQCATSAIEACSNADGVIIATEWPEFKELDFGNLYNVLRSPIIIDLRNILDPNKLKHKGFKYYSIGRKYEV